MSDAVSMLTQFQNAIAQRRAAEDDLRSISSGPDVAETALRQHLTRNITLRDQSQSTLTCEFQTVRQQAESIFNLELSELEQAHTSTLKSIEGQAARETSELEQQRDESKWVVSSVLDENSDDGPVREFEKFKAVLLRAREEQLAEWRDLDETFKAVKEERGWSGSPPHKPQTPPKDRDAASQRFTDAVVDARGHLKKVKSLLLPKLFKGFRSLIVFSLLSIVIAIPIFLLVDPAVANFAGERMQPGWIGISAGFGAMAGLLLTIILWTLGAMHQSDVMKQFQQSTAEANWVHQHWMKLAKEQLEQRQKESERKHQHLVHERETAFQRYESALTERKTTIETNRYYQVSQARSEHSKLKQKIEAVRDSQLAEIDAEHARRMEQHASHWEMKLASVQVQLDALISERQRKQAELWTKLKSGWENSFAQLMSDFAQKRQGSQQRFAPWHELSSHQWQPATTIPDLMQLGNFQVDLSNWTGAIPADMRLAPRTTQHQLPCTLNFPEQLSLLIKSPNAAARQQAIQLLQTTMLRLMVLIPPGKIRFTIIDPVGLGESFGGFMHLTDYDEMMVTNRIWTEPGQIEARLADLTEQMENVLQKYLRNEFQTIEEYNFSAGEVAEPYHILVISDFPAKCSEIAARRLISIVNSGPRCGVYTLMNIDPSKQLPNNFHLKDFEPAMTCLEWRDGAYHSTEPELKNFPLVIDEPPAPEGFTSIVKMIGEASKDARRVEVAFSKITPDPKDLWTGDSRSEIEVPLGRAGATKLQRMKLGKGTSQHMLVAGKTGSGKSTFLHIMITNLALHYSPDEVNFFLIDFKKGVEFKDYATLQLPHAKVIAIESDREFGISALQKLDDVLQERGELFRKHGVQDIAGFRNANPKTALPRILLIIDEFQEFFIEEDKLSQSATLLLDRLVRQGRAFGVHVILGSQTLGGAYSLARSTLGQVAVRVALQCSESDAHLILSEENTAARLLTRPGEAIYNDANGMLEGNNPFQIAWLSDEIRNQHLRQIQELALRKGVDVDVPIVFEGNIPSDLTRNKPILKLAAEFSIREVAVSPLTVWLGDAVEIKPATEIAFPRQNGAHLLIVGQDAEAAQGILAAGFLSLAASLSQQTSSESLFILNGHPVDSEETANWRKLVENIPSQAQLLSPRDTGDFLNAMYVELKKREADETTIHPPIVMFIDNISKFRDLRKSEDDFGMGSFGSSGAEKPPEPGKIFADLLTMGPPLGIHVIIWCDSYNNVERWFSRQTLRELEQRVAFQMNASDSSNLIDSPAASRLGTHRALLYREETGTFEKFRPYGLPSADWLNTLRQQMLHGAGAELATDLEEFSIL